MLAGQPAQGDVGPPVEIKMAADTSAAVPGLEYGGTFEIRLFRPGMIDNVAIGGDGWTVASVDWPDGAVDAVAGVLRVPFRATPSNANSPIKLSFTYNGRKLSRAYEIGPAYFARAGKPLATRRIAETSGIRADARANDATQGSSPAGDAIPLHAVGRIVYDRIGMDNNNDGDFDDPGDVPPRTLGVDYIRIRFIDDDDISSEVIWSGETDHNGFFDTGVVMWDDCDVVGCDTPDLVLEFEADTSVVDVTDNSVLEETYTWQTEEITNFGGSFHDFGVLTPADSGLMPALHIYNSIVRVERFIRTNTDYNPSHVQVEWPDGDTGAWYERGPQEIHISTGRQWWDVTHTHEFGHHFLNLFSFPQDTDYCNDYCDGNTPCTSGVACENLGHCIWCPENTHDAFNEGWPNWLGDVVMRSYPLDYQNDDGTPFQPLFTRNQETPATCCQDQQSYPGTATEGYVGLLLRDIEDSTQDDHDTDGIMDSLCLGVEEIFDTVVLFHPNTVLEFINGFNTIYPDEMDLLWPTAFNVAPSFVANFPADSLPPALVTVLDSPTHPLGVGGPLPCIVVEWDRAEDDVSGACDYSFNWSTDPAGSEPDEAAVPYALNGCKLTTAAGFVTIGDYYFSIKAQDCGDLWDNDWEVFGPFTITDCNGTGILDLCDIDCDHPGYPGCPFAPGVCVSQPGCGLSEDCQPNLAPDECDIADGTSEDCNETDVPDECETVFHWGTNTGDWENTNNWEEEQLPVDGSDVCIDTAGDVTATLTHTATDIGILACNESLEIVASGLPWPDMTLNDPSWIRGDLILHGNTSYLRVNDQLDIDGLFDWTGTNDSNVSHLTGPGETHVHGSMQIAAVTHLVDHTLVLEGQSSSTATGWLLFDGASSLYIRPGATYDIQGTGSAISGWTDDTFVNEGTLIKSVDSGEANVSIFTENSGLIHVQDGTLTFTRGGTISGDLLADPAATVKLRGGSYNFLDTSSIVAETVEFRSGGSGGNFIRGTYNVSATTIQDGQALTFTDEATIINYGPVFSVEGLTNFNAIIGGPIHFDSLSVVGGTADFSTGDPVDADTLVVGPGTIKGPGIITANNHFSWNASGHVSGPSVFNIMGTSTVGPGGGEKTLRDRVLNNHGTMTMLGGFQMLSAAELNNLPGAVIDIQFDSGAATIGGGATIPFNNQGTLLKSAGVGTSTVSTPITNTGAVEIQTGILSFSKTYVQDAGQTVLSGGELAMWWSNSSNNPPLQVNGGIVTGSGTISSNQDLVVNNAGGTFAPGASAGTIIVTGNYVQSTGSSIEIEIGGTADGLFDTLEMTGAASLAGSLVVTEIDAFLPSAGDTFVILTASAISGKFDTFSAPPWYEIEYNANNVTLNVPTAPADLDSNGNIDLHDWSLLQVCFGGSGNPPSPSCPAGIEADLDQDGEVDLDDYARFFTAAGL